MKAQTAANALSAERSISSAETEPVGPVARRASRVLRARAMVLFELQQPPFEIAKDLADGGWYGFHRHRLLLQYMRAAPVRAADAKF
jgi:hypothetical protein